MSAVRLHRSCVGGGSERAVSAGHVGNGAWRQSVERCVGERRGSDMYVSSVAVER